MRNKRKLIEVALPLEAINVASAREKSIRHGHPSTLHLWWARRPLAAARAIIFAQMVDDPSEHGDIFKTEKAQDKERQRLFRIIEELVKWESTTDESVLQQARDAMWQSWRYTCAENADHPRAQELFDRHRLPRFHDPFAGGGALPLEAQRLGLQSIASDLNPVAVLINKAMIEIPPQFSGSSPVNPEWIARREDEKALTQWHGAQGLAEDLRFYGLWMRDEAWRQIGHLYPKVRIVKSMVTARPDLSKHLNEELTVVAWLWARTVKSPNPAFNDVDVPLVSSFVLSPMSGKETYVEPVIEGRSYRFEVRIGKPPESAKGGTKMSRGAHFRCLLSDTPIPSEHIYEEATAGRMGSRLMAIVAEGDRARIYLSPTSEMETIGLRACPDWKPDVLMPENPRWFSPPLYGLKSYGDLFTPRQLVALTTFADLVAVARERVERDAIAAGIRSNAGPGNDRASAYANAVATYLGFLVSKLADKGSSICTWDSGPSSNKTASGRSARVATVRVTFGRQALPMTWDYAEVNFFSDSVGSIDTVLKTLSAPLKYFPVNPPGGHADQADAQVQSMSDGSVISTDPPYYDNIGYADLSDFFYVWLRRCLKNVYPDLFSTVAVPKAEELVATPYRHGGKKSAEAFFLDGMTRAMHRLADQAHPAFPVTIYYAFKQAESDGADGTTNTGWDTFLAAIIKAGFAISGTWPVRTEMGNRMIGSGTNALASSIVLVCRKITGTMPIATRREFLAELKAELPKALLHLQAGNIAPVDLAQAAIGPGMAIYTRYAQVLNAEGEALSVRAALALINQTLDDALTEQEGDFDSDTRWALTWFEQSGFQEGEYGIAEQLSKSKNTSVGGLVSAGILLSRAGKVRLLKAAELLSDWDPMADARLTVWEIVHQMIKALESGGERAAALLVTKLGGRADTARELCYRLYVLCERKKRTAEAISYNGLVQSWPEISRIAGSVPVTQSGSSTDDMFAKE